MPAQPPADIRNKSEENLKQLYSSKIELLQSENDRLQAKVDELAGTVRNLKMELQLAKEQARTNQPTKLANTNKETQQVRCHILAFNNRLNLLIVSAGKDKGLVQDGEYSIYYNNKLVGKVKIDKLEQDWASGSVHSDQDINQIKAGDGEITLTP